MKTKEKGMIFNSEDVRAILEGRKTQVRRLVEDKNGDLGGYEEWLDRRMIEMSKPPYGQPGDRIWVRETWQCYEWLDEKKQGKVCYRTDEGHCCKFSGHLWLPSIHMPRWASRITLEITDVRVERIQDISEEDCKAQGFKDQFEEFEIKKSGSICWYAKWGFLCAWRKNHPGSWERNDWVWVYEFKVLKRLGGQHNERN